MIWFVLAAGAQDLPASPGGERIPFVKLRSEVWDVVIRKTADDRARIERVKASCNGIWVNACAPGVDPELRQIALGEVFKDGIQLSGDFTYCSTAVLRGIPADMARGLIEPGTEAFCGVFLDPESVRAKRSGNATAGENALVSRLMGSENSTSGEVRIKSPTGNGEFIATGERRQPGVGVATVTQRGGAPAPQPAVRPMPGAPAPAAPVARPPEAEDEWAFLNEPSRPVPTGGSEPTPAASPVATGSSVAAAPVTPPAPTPEPITFEDDPVYTPRPAAPAPAPTAVDEELAALLAPIPTIDSQAALVTASTPRAPAPEPVAKPAPAPEPTFIPDPEPKGVIGASGEALVQPTVEQVAVPAPRPEPPRPAPAPKPAAPNEFDLEAQEMAGIERLSDRGAEEEGKKAKKAKKDEPATGGDAEYDNYIIIDIEGLEDE